MVQYLSLWRTGKKLHLHIHYNITLEKLVRKSEFIFMVTIFINNNSDPK